MPAKTPELTQVQLAVFRACVDHASHSFSPVTPDAWWRAEPPFRGGRSTFAAHLRALSRRGLLVRTATGRASYELSLRGEELAAGDG